MKRAFTLIELLVVIAIIAILAAILFPVFAQAKLAAKKAATLSNAKQLTTGTLIYISDTDDTLPITRAVDAATNTNMARNLVWASDDTFTTPSPVTRAMWGNAIKPYLKAQDIFKSVVGQDYNLFNPMPAVIGTQRYGFYINAYVNVLNATAVDQPANTNLYLEAAKDRQSRMYFASFPLPFCGTNETVVPWRLDINANSLSVFTYQMDSTWANYGSNLNLSYIDGHAKTVAASSRENMFKQTSATFVPYPTGWNSVGINVEQWAVGGFWFRPAGIFAKS
jgi:prepilin-type N-terminal cleavage/methylation domain-containing protein